MLVVFQGVYRVGMAKPLKSVKPVIKCNGLPHSSFRSHALILAMFVAAGYNEGGHITRSFNLLLSWGWVSAFDPRSVFDQVS
jgi:hypothetical protein